MTTQEVAKKLVELCRNGENLKAINELYADHILSVEPHGAQVKEVEGKQAVIEKELQFFGMIEEVHLSEVSDPLVADNFFSVRMKMIMTLKGMGRINMDEICVYQVENGEIVREEFFFTPAPIAVALN
jgi:hypothetical protein